MLYEVITILGIVSVSAGEPSDNEWNLILTGNHISSITQGEYEKGINVEQPSNYFASVVDDKGQVWDGIVITSYSIHYTKLYDIEIVLGLKQDTTQMPA